MPKRFVSPATREKIAAAKRGKPRPDLAERNRTTAQREAVAVATRGKKRPDLAARNATLENRKAVRRALTGREFSPESIERMRAGQKRRHAT